MPGYLLCSLGVAHSATAFHQVNENLVSDADNAELLDFPRSHLPDGPIWQRHHCLDYTLFILNPGFDKQVDIHRIPKKSGGSHCKAADDDIMSFSLIEGSAELDDVLQRRWPAFLW